MRASPLQTVGLTMVLVSFASMAFQAPIGATAYEDHYERGGNVSFLWLAAETHAQASDRTRAVASLSRLLGQDSGFMITRHSPLHRLRKHPSVDRIAAQLAGEFRTIRHASLARTVTVPNLIAEGIASDERRDAIYVGDMAHRQVLVIRRAGPARVFALTGALRPLGMKVDNRRRLLWVAASTAFIAGEVPRSSLLAFDLKTGRLQSSTSSKELRSLNDVALAPNGDLYVTDTLGGALFRLRHDGTELERVTSADSLTYPNGVVVSGDGRWVYIAEGLGLSRVSTSNAELTPVQQPRNLALLSIDGMVWYRGGIVAIQNGVNPGRIIRLDLSSDAAVIRKAEILEAGNPFFDLPTTATLNGDALIVIANSQADRLGKSGTITPGTGLKALRLLKLKLH